jgi:hypothetical protein
MKTAVEWLVQKLSKEWVLEERDLYLIEQAKELEEEQHYETWNNAYDKGTRDRLEKVVDPVGDADTYFKETFKTE